VARRGPLGLVTATRSFPKGQGPTSRPEPPARRSARAPMPLSPEAIDLLVDRDFARRSWTSVTPTRRRRRGSPPRRSGRCSCRGAVLRRDRRHDALAVQRYWRLEPFTGRQPTAPAEASGCAPRAAMGQLCGNEAGALNINLGLDSLAQACCTLLNLYASVNPLGRRQRNN
jgi:hypothetical protein